VKKKMKKLLVALTMVIFVIGLVLPTVALEPPAIDDGYHEVYEYDYAAGVWVPINAIQRVVEMFTQGSQIEQYRWESDPAAQVCQGPYFPPEPEDPESNNLFVKNYVHYFPWIEMHIVNNELVWDVFKPGDYMAKAFMVGLQANCPVLIHFGSGAFPAPTGFEFDPTNKDGHILFGDKEIDDTPENAVEDKEWLYSMLNKGSEGTPPDVIDVMWWWVQGTQADWDDPHYMTNAVPAKDNVVPSPHGPFPTGWVRAPEMNCDYTIVPDTEELHEGKYIIFYEDINIETCDSEGKYFDEFVITIVPDP